MRVRPRSSEKNAWLLSPPSIVLLLSSPEMPRKLIKPKLPSGTEPGVRSAKFGPATPVDGQFVDGRLVDVGGEFFGLDLTAAAAATMSTVAVAAPTLQHRLDVAQTSDLDYHLIQFELGEPGGGDGDDV